MVGRTNDNPTPIMAMGCSSSKQQVVLRIGERDFPRHLLESLCSDGQSNISKLVLSMRAAGFIGSLLQQLAQATAAGPQPQPPTDSRPRRPSADSSQTVVMSDGNTYELDMDTVLSASQLPTVLADVHELMVYHSSGRTLDNFLDLSPFANVSKLCLMDVPIHLVHYLKTLRPRLRHISVHRCIDSPKKLFELCGGDQAFPALWTRLEIADLRWNCLRGLDDSFKLLSCLHTLDLSNNRLSDVTGLELLTNLQVLNLSYNCVTRLPNLMDSTKNALRVLLIRFNRLTELQGMEQFLALGVLDISNNVICRLEKLDRMRGLRHLYKLNLANNPFEVAQRSGRMDILRYVNRYVPFNFRLNGRPLSAKEDLFLRKVRVSRITPSSTPLSSSITVNQATSVLDSSVGGYRLDASVDSRRDLVLPDTGGSEADISSSDAEGYLTNSLTGDMLVRVMEARARARMTRNHLDKVRGRYGANWLVNWNRSEFGRSIPSPPPNLLEPLASVEPSPVGRSEQEAPKEARDEPQEEKEEEKAASPARDDERKDEPEETTMVRNEQSSESLMYVTAQSNFSSGHLPSSPQSSRGEAPPPEIYPMRWEREEEEEEPQESVELDGEGLHFVVTPLTASGPTEQRMLVIGATHCLLCCVRTGRVADRHELRLLTSVRREADGCRLALAFRCALPAARSRRFQFAAAEECERCRAELARHLEVEEGLSGSGGGGGGGGGGGMHCFRCRNQVDASRVARVMELDPSTGERVLVPACPHCGFRALAEDAESEEERRQSAARCGSSPVSSSFSSSLAPTGASPDVSRSTLASRFSASSSTTSSCLVRVPCDWIHFDRSDFSEFDHQIKRHFALHVLTSDTEVCRLHIKCHGTPCNRAELHECIVLFTNKKFYFFRWKFHESQQVAKCLTLQDKIDHSNLLSIRPGPCFQWLLLEFKNAKRSLLYPGDPTSSERFLRQLSEYLEPNVIDFSSERTQREALCTVHLATAVDTDSGEQLLLSLGLPPNTADAAAVGLWVCRCPGAKYTAVPLTATLHKWANREVKRDWTLLALNSGRFLIFELEYQVGWDVPKPKLSKVWNVTDISGVKRGKDGLTLTFSFFRQKGGTLTEEPPKSLSIIFEEELAMMHFFAPFQAVWEHFYEIPLLLK